MAGYQLVSVAEQYPETVQDSLILNQELQDGL